MTATTLLKNPFDYTSPVQSSGAYFGLSAVQKRLAGWHSPDTRISVTGSRRLGTTSTINMMAETVAEQDTSVVYLDLRLLPRPVTASSVASEILARLGYQATTGNPSRNLTQIIQSANEPVGPLVLVLDEFDLVDGADVHVLLGLLVFVLPNGIELLNRRHNAKSNTTIFIGSRRSLFDLERAVQCIDSPWYQSFRTLNLRPLDKKEATRLISESSSLGGVPLVNEAAWLIAFGGTWPFYIKLASHYAFEAKQHTHAGRLSRRDRGTVEERVWEEALPHLASYWAALSSRQRDLLANLKNWLRMGPEGRFDPDIISFTRDGVVAVSRGSVDYTCALFRSFFTNQATDEGLTGHSIPPANVALTSIAECLSRLGSCAAELSNWDDSKESNIQELAYVVLRSQYRHVSRERFAGEGPRRDYKIDLRVEDVDVLVEVKRVRSASHVQRLQSEINDDIAGYRSKKSTQRLVFLIWDKEHRIGDRDYFIDMYQARDPRLRVVFTP